MYTGLACHCSPHGEGGRAFQAALVLLVDVPGAAHCCFTACSRWVDLLSVPGGLSIVSRDRAGTRDPGRSDRLVRATPRNRGAFGPYWCPGARRPAGPDRTPDGALPDRGTQPLGATTLPVRGGGAEYRG
jgi:hypothetical protein